MKKIILAVILFAATVGFTSCDHDHYRNSLFDTIVGRVWSGDLQFKRDGRYPLISNVLFGADGFGEDQLRYADNGEPLVPPLRISWDTNDHNAIYINYGNADYPRELRNVRIYRGEMRADLYIDGYYQRPTVLYMQ